MILTAAFFLAVNVGPWGPGVPYLRGFLSALALQHAVGIFPLTWSLSVALFLSTWWIFLKRTALAAWRSFIVGGTIPFAAVSLFEIPYILFNRAAHPWYSLTAWDVVSIVSWLLVGLTGIGWWRVRRSYWVFLAAYAGSFVAWFAIGFPNIDISTGSSLVVAYALNISLKIACFPLAAWPLWQRVGLLRPFSEGRLRTPQTSPNA